MDYMKQFLTALLRSPAFIAVFVPAVLSFVNANQQWLFPNVPSSVMDAFNNLVTVVCALVAAFIAGTLNQQITYKAQAAKILAKEHPQELVE